LLHATLYPVLPRTYERENCSIARSLELIGERWTLLVLREAFTGARRFDEFATRLDIARNVLTARLSLLVEEGVLERRRYQERPERFEYRLTEKGLELFPVLVSLMKWGDRHAPARKGPPTLIVHRDCGGEVDERFHCERCGAEVEARDATARPGPGSRRRSPSAAL
jgi:DNA-binding HxlR family transcriptional regulator